MAKTKQEVRAILQQYLYVMCRDMKITVRMIEFEEMVEKEYELYLSGKSELLKEG